MKFPFIISGLAFVTLSAHAQLNIQLTSQTENPSIRKEGGVLEVQKTLNNNGSTNVAVKVYSHVTFPDGKTFVDAIPTELYLSPGESFTDSNSMLEVPASFPRGSYSYHYSVYNQDNSQILSDSITFEKKSRIIDVAVSHDSACGTDLTGTLCWKLTDGRLYTPTPEPIYDIKDIAINSKGGCAIVGKEVKCWSNRHYRTHVQSFWKALPSAVTFTDPQKIFVAHTYDNYCAIDGGEIICWSSGKWNPGAVNTAPPKYSELKNPSRIEIGRAAACIRHDDGIDCWGAKSSPTVSDVPTFTNPTHLIVGLDYACAKGDEGVKCWGKAPASDLNAPELLPHTELRFGYPGIYSYDERGMSGWSTRPAQIGPYQMQELINPIDIDFDYGYVCALDDTGIVCGGRNNAANTVPERFKY
ncbi:hypothetical protein [Pseudoalteromonas luteoviolacea]|uniref:CARDB domain-containing protein n=1 Tax=Pseudoalteromonas luteoviolacea H33 TaxID=1365251 RepID=A0A162AEQ7_9GAMM|nr:hypothetical protein [Pseudoalteromonas luteoviolacea]KZN48513.1 hypothetical protein N476_21815 [Pseudoalteromonas luteoviolacea H33]KZN73374.1 hypothetical protein N477_23915 [Pseudoalteromonas luteoviolacea H33-S]MBQ4876517.1 hypothetical protein [Pseudoalteromonas luteoviolacea]MBQ4905148.1 hypothetical protein [Pseudoalteromonas luteoviolacea]